MHLMQKIAEIYRAAGLAIVWLDEQSKRTYKKCWSLQSQEPGDYKPGNNIGILTGWLSQDVVCIDLDSAEAIRLADEYLPATDMIEGRQSKTRAHRYYRVTSIPEQLKSTAGGGVGGPCTYHYVPKILDVQGTGSLVVAPQSSYPDGEIRYWCHGLRDAAVVDCDQLYLAADNLALACGGRTKRNRQEVKPASGGAVQNYSDVMMRALAYLNRIPAAISGQGGHDRLFWAARCLCWGFCLDEDSAFDLLVTYYNPRCQPFWSDRELLHKIAHASRPPFGKPYGWLLEEPER